MSFFYQIKQKATFLRTYPDFKIHNPLDKQKVFKYLALGKKRMSLFISYLFMPYGTRASITVEASLVLPLFLFAVINILSMFDILRFQGNLQAAIHQTGKKMAVYGYAYDKIGNAENPLLQGIENIGFTNLYVEHQVKDFMGSQYENNIFFLHSKIMEKEKIDIIATYKKGPVISVIPFGKMNLTNRCRMRAWTGYDNTGRNMGGNGRLSETMVYITATGDVYHTSRNCSHLSLSIKGTDYTEVTKKRNESGEKYHACELCGNKKGGSALYITGQGNRYHTSLYCGGLKRSISCVPLSKTGGRPLCERCGGSAW